MRGMVDELTGDTKGWKRLEGRGEGRGGEGKKAEKQPRVLADL